MFNITISSFNDLEKVNFWKHLGKIEKMMFIIISKTKSNWFWIGQQMNET